MKTPLIALTIATAAALTACGSEPTNTSAEDSPSASESATEEGASEDAAEVLTKEFGSTFTWDDGVAITVTEPEPFTSGPYASPENADGVKMDVTIENGSTEPFPSLMVNLTATSGDQESEAIFDEGIDLPTADILPGKSLKFTAAFTKPGDDFVLAVQHGLNASGYYIQR